MGGGNIKPTSDKCASIWLKAYLHLLFTTQSCCTYYPPTCSTAFAIYRITWDPLFFICTRWRSFIFLCTFCFQLSCSLQAILTPRPFSNTISMFCTRYSQVIKVVEKQLFSNKTWNLYSTIYCTLLTYSHTKLISSCTDKGHHTIADKHFFSKATFVLDALPTPTHPLGVWIMHAHISYNLWFLCTEQKPPLITNFMLLAPSTALHRNTAAKKVWQPPHSPKTVAEGAPSASLPPCLFQTCSNLPNLFSVFLFFRLFTIKCLMNLLHLLSFSPSSACRRQFPGNVHRDVGGFLASSAGV